jgi:hypothetical protein
MYDMNPNPKPSRNPKVKEIYIGQRAGWGKKNCSSSLLLTALTIMGICNVRAHLTTASMMDGQTLLDTLMRMWPIYCLQIFEKKQMSKPNINVN